MSQWFYLEQKKHSFSCQIFRLVYTLLGFFLVVFLLFCLVAFLLCTYLLFEILSVALVVVVGCPEGFFLLSKLLGTTLFSVHDVYA